MGTWREVKSADELKDGQRIRYYDGTSWDNCYTRRGVDYDPRFWRAYDQICVDYAGNRCLSVLFDCGWPHIEAMFDDHDAQATTTPDRDTLLAIIERLEHEVAELKRHLNGR